MKARMCTVALFHTYFRVLITPMCSISLAGRTDWISRDPLHSKQNSLLRNEPHVAEASAYKKHDAVASRQTAYLVCIHDGVQPVGNGQARNPV